MNILKAIIENYKKIKMIEITPSGNVVILSGKNGQGKSSALDAIITTIAGKDKSTTEPVNTAAEEANIELDMGEFIIKRKIRGDRDEITVLNKEGFSMSKPRTFLSELYSDLNFDPLAFIGKNKKEQREILLAMAGVKFDDLDTNREAIYNDRTFIGREVDAMKGQLAGMPEDPEAPAGLVNVFELTQELQNANAYNEGMRRTQGELESILAAKKQVAEQIAQLNARFEELEKQATETSAKLAGAELKDTESIQAKIASAEELNARANKAIIRKDLAEKFAAKEAEYKAKTEQIAAVDAEKLARLQSAKFPVDGLSISEDGVIFNGLPFEQESMSNKLKVSLAIATSLPSKLRVVAMDNAEILDDDNIKLVEQMMVEKDYQAWIVRRQDAGDGVYTIVEGEISK